MAEAMETGEFVCECDLSEGAFRGKLQEKVEGCGLALYCAQCEGYIEDAWLFTDGIPVEVTAEAWQTYTGEWQTSFDLKPAR